MINCLLAMAALAAAGNADAAETATPSLAVSPVSAAAEPTQAANILIAGTIIDLVFVDPVDSKANKVGDIIAMKVADDVLVGTAVVIAAGTPVSAEVIHAARARAGGKPGELIISARFIQLRDRQIPLKGFKFGTSGTGKSKVTESVVVAAVIAAPLALFIAGGEKHADPGTRAFAKFKDDFDYGSILGSIITPKQISAPEIIQAQNTEGKIQ